MAKDITLKRINKFGKDALKDMNHLLLQLSSRGYQMTPRHFKEVIKNKYVHLMGLYDGSSIIGTATLVLINQITGCKGYIEDVVVDEKYRGRGLGKKLLLNIISLAQKLKLDSLELKSEPHHIVANIIYKKLGFETKEANVYTMKLWKKN